MAQNEVNTTPNTPSATTLGVAPGTEPPPEIRLVTFCQPTIKVAAVARLPTARQATLWAMSSRLDPAAWGIALSGACGNWLIMLLRIRFGGRLGREIRALTTVSGAIERWSHGLSACTARAGSTRTASNSIATANER